jgi:hypothetical protein
LFSKGLVGGGEFSEGWWAEVHPKQGPFLISSRIFDDVGSSLEE